MNLLLIGGSQFVGRHIVQIATARGDQVTVFNRGQTATEWPAGVQVRRGDRKGDLSALAGGEWDAVIDTCGYLPGDVARMADCLYGRVGRYVFISSVSVYAGFSRPNDEQGVVGRIDDTDATVVDGRTYGPLKALCEQAIATRFGASALTIRPGLVVGPHDPTQRFTYWPARVARALAGEPVLAPGPAGAPVQFIDVRDLAAFVLKAADDSRGGPFNVVTPPGAFTMGAVLDACADAAGTRPHWVWADAAAVEDCGLQPWSDLPLWLPATGDHAAFALTPNAKAQAAGLQIRPLTQTVADTLAWYRTLPGAQQAFSKAGLSAEREAAALAKLARR
ncbi:MAG: NAD-dependent epimerase/dehydratase family protein [Pseudomonadota bacterium]